MVQKAEHHKLPDKQTKPENIHPNESWIHLLHAVHSSPSFNWNRMSYCSDKGDQHNHSVFHTGRDETNEDFPDWKQRILGADNNDGTQKSQMTSRRRTDAIIISHSIELGDIKWNASIACYMK